MRDLRYFLLLGVALAMACGERSERMQRAIPEALARHAPVSQDVPTGDPTLAAARKSLKSGQIDPGLNATLRGSDLPVHARARRLLAAMQDPIPEPPPVADSGKVKLDAPTLRVGSGVPEKTAKVRASSPAKTQAGTAAVGAPTPKAKQARGTLRTMGLRKTKVGASLTLRGSKGLSVGVVSQPQSGLLRLVVEASAAASALQARPQIPGARVTAVRRTADSVFVTLSLEPGWSLVGIVRTKAGARVDLRRPG